MLRIRDLVPDSNRARGLVRDRCKIGERSRDRLTALRQDRPDIALLELSGLFDRQIGKDPDPARIDNLEQFISRSHSLPSHHMLRDHRSGDRRGKDIAMPLLVASMLQLM